MDSSETKTYYQNVLVMRHGDRMDNFDPTWVKTAERRWDPPLIQNCLARAFRTGRMFRTFLPFPIHRVFVSPFPRCVQTASEVVAVLCAVDDNPNAKSSTDIVSIDPSKVKLEALLPSGTLDHNVEQVYKELPQWEETVMGTRTRYEQIIKALADKYPSENLLLVSHGEGVGFQFLDSWRTRLSL